MILRKVLCGTLLLAGFAVANAVEYTPENVSATVSLKVPGNDAVRYPLTFQTVQKGEVDYQLVGSGHGRCVFQLRTAGKEWCKSQ